MLFPGVETILSEDTCGVGTMSDLTVSLEAAIAIAGYIFLSAYKNQEIHVHSGDTIWQMSAPINNAR